MARLLEAVRPDARLILVGDPDQLASVEAGAVLARPRRPPQPDFPADGLPKALAWPVVPADLPADPPGSRAWPG